MYLRKGLQQPIASTSRVAACCELLSNCTFARAFNSPQTPFANLRRVVSCFQIVPSQGPSTAETFVHKSHRSCELLSNCTFARAFNSLNLLNPLNLSVVSCFQIVPSQGPSTAAVVGLRGRVSCELLSNCTFARAFNSRWYRCLLRPRVVSCFQIVPSQGPSTAAPIRYTFATAL